MILRSEIWSFWLSLVVAAVAAKPILTLLLAMKSRQTVSQYAPETHQAKQGTPTMGGLIVAAGAVPGLAFAAAEIGSQSGGPNMPLVALVLFALFAAIGFVDDYVVPRMIPGKRGLGWKQKILMQLVAGLIGGYMMYGPNPAGLAIGVFTILFFSNAYNFSDGLDGLAASLLLGLGGAFCLIGSIHTGYAPISWMLVPILAAIVPFLFLNAPPARVFMGDVGSLAIGAVLGCAASAVIFAPRGMGPGWVFTSPDGFRTYSPSSLPTPQFSATGLLIVVIAGLVMIAELVPVPLQILSVKLRGKRLFPYTPIHHAFEKAGWPESRVVWTFALVQVICAAIAVSIVALPLASVLTSEIP